MRYQWRPVLRRLQLAALGVLALLGAGTSSAVAAEQTPVATGEAPATVRRILMIQVSPRAAPALLAQEQAFLSTLKATLAESVTLHSEYLELTMFDQQGTFEEELVTYLAAKYARTKLDLVVVVASTGLRFALRHRARLFPGVPIVFTSVDRQAASDIVLEPDVSGVWLSMDWAGTLEAARRLQPDIERVFVVTGASAVDRVWAAAARAQLDHLDPPVPVTYLENLLIEAVVERLAAVPRRSVVLLGAFQADAAGRRFFAPETTARFSVASRVPMYALTDASFGHGIVGGHLVSFERQGQRAAELAARVLRGEQPPPVDKDTNVFKFDARQLRRWGLDAGRLPPGSTLAFDEPTLWQAYRGYIVATVVLLALQTWLIVVLLANRSQRLRAQRALAGQLRFERLLSEVLASHATSPTTDAHVDDALALLGADLDVDRIVLAERDTKGRRVEVTHAWTREGIEGLPSSLEWRMFPWMSTRLGAGHVIIVSPEHPLPPEAEEDRRQMATHGTRSLLAIPLILKGAPVGVLSCATLRVEREWPDALIERLRLLAEVFASVLARRRAEAAARDSEERLNQQRQELAHALRVNTLGELAASLAHEINQPLAAILVNARVVRTLLARGTVEPLAMREALNDIADDARRAADIIDRLRALSRKEHAAQRGLSLDALVDGVVDLLHEDFLRRGIVIRRGTGPGLPPLSGDPIQLEQIVLNLLVNAAEALDGVERGAREISILTSHPAPKVVELAVRDTGVGGKSVDVERMFERFVTTKPGGLGMGLAISRSIAEAHGGRIYAKANTDRGLTVFVELPAED
jgi:C4-dicarboxylate-specific signal transduction histidine kinase